MHWMSILGLCLILLGSVFSFLGTYYSDRSSQAELTSKIQEKNKTIEEIKMDNVSLLSKIDKYQLDIDGKSKRIQTLESEVSNVKDYSYYGSLDMFGRSFIPGSNLIYTSDLSNKMEKIFIVQDGKAYVRNEKSVMPLVEEVIQNYPNFPFGYYAKYEILKSFGNKEWKNVALKAQTIFEITTSIKGHNTAHDEALASIKISLINK